MSPDEYFCEECRKDLHRIRGEANGYVHKISFSISFLVSFLLSLMVAFRICSWLELSFQVVGG
jgi:hypothetical protein